MTIFICFAIFSYGGQYDFSTHFRLDGGGRVVMVLGKLPVPGRTTTWIRVGQGPIALAVGAGGVFGKFFPRLSFLFDID